MDATLVTDTRVGRAIVFFVFSLAVSLALHSLLGGSLRDALAFGVVFGAIFAVYGAFGLQ